MATPVPKTRLAWRRPQGRTALALGMTALGIAVLVAVTSQRTVTARFTLSAGAAGTTRGSVAEALIEETKRRGAEGQLVTITGVADELAEVNDGRVDFALLSGAYHLGPHEHVREVSALYVEALHLLVKEELAGEVTADLGALRAHTVDLGPRGSETEGIAKMALVFAQLAGSQAGETPLRTVNLEYDDLQRRFDSGDASSLPDAIFQLAIVPSRLALPFIRQRGYRLVPLPFADAMRLNALTSHIMGAPHEVDWQYITEATVPAFTYSMRPPVPVSPLPTIGSRLLLVANEQVPNATVELLLDTVFHSRFARIAEPPLEPSVLSLPPRIHLHPGTLAFTRRNDPLLTADSVDTMNNMLGIVGALLGSSLFLFQWRRQRVASQRDELFGSYVLRAADLERRLAALELSATLELPALVALQREVLEVKAEALERFAAGELGSQTALFQLLEPLNTTRDQIGNLLLHVRETIEDRAASEGRSEQAVWRDAAKGSGEPTDKP